MSDIEWNKPVVMLTGHTVINNKGEPMTLAVFCVEMLCVSKPDAQDSAEDRIRNGIICQRLLEGQPLKDGELSRIVDRVKQFATTACLIPALKALGQPIE